MKIALGTIEITDEQRRDIAIYYGDNGLADRGTCRDFIVGNGMGALDTLSDNDED